MGRNRIERASYTLGQQPATPRARLQPIPPLLELQAMAGNEVVNRLVDGHIQAKLLVGAASDSCELEADQVAQAVVQGLGSPAATPVADAAVARSTALVGAEGGSVDVDLEAGIKGARGGGRPLDRSTRTRMEAAFWADFGAVRVHTGPEVDGLNDNLQSRAFTLGSDIFVRRADFAPGTRAGDELLAHELTHTVQQGAATVRRTVEVDPEGRQRSGPVLQRWWNPFKSTRGKKESEISSPTGSSHGMTAEEQRGVPSMGELIAIKTNKDRRQELADALQSPDPKANPAFVKWRDTAKEKWMEAAKKAKEEGAEPPTDEALFSAWSRIATAFSAEGGLIDKALASQRGLAHKQSGAFSAGSFGSWDEIRIVMGTPEFQGVLDDAGVLADSFADLFVKDLVGQPEGAKVAFWSGDGASDAAKDNCDVALEKSKLARAFDYNAISTWTGGTEAILWASLSNRYATEVARQWDKFEVHGFIGPGVRDLTVFDRIESKAVLKVLGEEHGSEALKRITWHGVKVNKNRKPDYTVTDGQMKGCFVKGRKTFVEKAVMGIREK